MSEAWNIPDAKLGVGAVVIKNHQVLLVQVNYGPAKGRWILPGGRVEANENLHQGVIREVFEETNIHVIAKGIVGFRQRIQADGLVDVYFICRCEIADVDLNTIPKAADPNEITAAKFWPIEEALNSPDVRPNTRKCIELGISNKTDFKMLDRFDGMLETDHFFA
jgi:8-oxo-dGTP diphosphatase